VLEKAQDRKKKTNLEEPKGISHNPFSILSKSAVSEIVADVGIKLGIDQIIEKHVVLEIVREHEDRKIDFDRNCLICKEESKVVNEHSNQQAVSAEKTPCTLVS
jgi:hypothetical protein